MDSENQTLAAAWDRHDAAHLDTYLVSGVEDPRINAQSILTRSLLIETLFPGRFAHECGAEMRAGMVLTWLLRALEAGHERHTLLDRLAQGTDATIPELVRTTYAWLQTPEANLSDYITAALGSAPPADSTELLNASGLNAFITRWKTWLPQVDAEKPHVLEIACGSANDFRYLEACGLATRLAYTGMDISAKNVENARRRYPETPFLHGSILDSGLPDASYDIVFTHDLLEHLSVDGIRTAMREMARLARRDIWIHLFNAHRAGEHRIVRQPPYHWNSISVEQLVATLNEAGFEADVLFTSAWMAERFGFHEHYNPASASIMAWRR